MNKKAFLRALSMRIRGLSRAEREESLAYYAEMIDDRVEAGMTQEAAVAAFGPVEEIAAQILQTVPRAEPGRIRSGRTKGEIALLALGFPLWFPLLIALLAIVISIYIVLWSLVVALCAAVASFALGAAGMLVGIAVAAIRGNFTQTALCFSLACALAGLALTLQLPCMRAAAGLARLGGRMAGIIRKYWTEGRAQV